MHLLHCHDKSFNYSKYLTKNTGVIVCSKYGFVIEGDAELVWQAGRYYNQVSSLCVDLNNSQENYSEPFPSKC